MPARHTSYHGAYAPIQATCDFVIDDDDLLSSQDSFTSSVSSENPTQTSLPGTQAEAISDRLRSSSASSMLLALPSSYEEDLLLGPSQLTPRPSPLTPPNSSADIVLATQNCSSTDVDPSSTEYPATQESPNIHQTSPRSSNVFKPMSIHIREAQELARVLGQYTRQEETFYRSPQYHAFQRQSLLNTIANKDLESLTDCIWSFETTLGMTEAELRYLKRSTYSILLSKTWDELRGVVTGDIMQSVPFAVQVMHDANHREFPVVYRLSIASREGARPSCQQMKLACDRLRAVLSFAFECSHWDPLAKHDLKELLAYRYLLKEAHDGVACHRNRVEILETFIHSASNANSQLCTIGFTTRPVQRRREHQAQSGSNWLLHLVSTILENMPCTSGKFDIWYEPLFRLFEPGHGVAEIVFTRLAMCTINNGGFTHYPPGRSIRGLDGIDAERWEDLRAWALDHTALKDQAQAFTEHGADQLSTEIERLSRTRARIQAKARYLRERYCPLMQG